MDVSLDDIIQQNRSRFMGRGRGRGRSGFALRGVRGGRIVKRSSGGGTGRVLPEKWQHDMFQRSSAPRTASFLRPTASSGKLHISNLDFGVSNDDINELFKDFGTLRRATVHYDRSGRSLGTAEVIFVNRLNAIKAQNHYNGVPLDGRPMVIQLVGAGANGSADTRTRVTPTCNSGASGGGRGSGGFRGRGFGYGRGMRGTGGRGRSRAQKPPVTKEELDAELAAYNAQRD